MCLCCSVEIAFIHHSLFCAKVNYIVEIRQVRALGLESFMHRYRDQSTFISFSWIYVAKQTSRLSYVFHNFYSFCVSLK